MSSSQASSQELSDMRTSQPLETDQPKAQHSMASNSVEVVPAMADFVALFLAPFQSTAGLSLAPAVK
ncbi:hypothetical protein ACHAQC_000941 [Fusarium culmorum]